MTIKAKISNSDLAWSYGAQFLQYGASLLVLPFVLKRLSAAEVGIWYAFNLVAILAGLLDFGFQGAFVRNVSYVVSGARQLEKEGVGNLSCEGNIDFVLLKSMIEVAKKNYRKIALVMFIALLTIGSLYIASITTQYPQKKILVASWLIFAIGTSFNFYWMYLGPCLIGLRAIKESQQAAVISRITGVICSVAGLLLGLGLLGVVSGFVLGSLSYPFAAMKYLNKHPSYTNAAKLSEKLDVTNLTHTIWHNAKKSGLVALATFLATRATALLASFYLPLETFAAYALTLQIFQMVLTLSRVNFSTNMPVLNSLVANNDITSFRHQFLSVLRAGWLLYFLSTMVVVFTGGYLLNALGSHTQLLPRSELILLALSIFMEMNFGTCAMALTCFNIVPTVRASWFTGTAITLGTLMILNFTDLGVLGIIVMQLVAHSLYNVWKWPLEVWRRIQIQEA
jgi:O-antigen/teichoic acid export membrane protein